MSWFTSLLNREITIVSPGSSSSGDDIVLGSLQQKSSNEAGGEVNFSTTDYSLFLQPETIITSKDRVLCDGKEYEVVGEPWEVREELLGTVHHIEVPLKIAGVSSPSTEFPDEESF